MDQPVKLIVLNSQTGEDTGQQVDAHVLDGQPIIMSFTTPTPRPDVPAGKAAVYLDAAGSPAAWWRDGEWVLKEDRRGTTYWLGDRSKHVITTIGEVPPDGALDADPGPSLDDARADQLRSISEACAEAITAGFTSSAIGDVVTYPSTLTDQANLNASVTASLMPEVSAEWKTPFMCCDSNGVWAARMHTASQIQRVGLEGKTAVLACLQRKWSLEQAIRDATTVADVLAIGW
jgi:hypothetical protein